MIKYSKRKFYNMTHTINPLADRRIPGILRLFYFVLNTLSTLWLLYYIQTMVALGPIKNVFAFVVLSLVYTLLSVGLSVYITNKLFDCKGKSMYFLMPKTIWTEYHDSTMKSFKINKDNYSKIAIFAGTEKLPMATFFV